MEVKAQREAYGEAMLLAGRKDKRVVALTADLGDSTRLFAFRKKFPERFFQMGVSEQAMVGLATGLSLLDFIPFASSFGVFVPGRAFDHVRVSIAQNNANVRLIGSHIGFTNAADGVTAQAIEDVALMRSLPNMTIISPCDALELEKAILTLIDFRGPVYLRMSRAPTPIFTKKDTPFTIGKAEVLKVGEDVTVVGTGPLLYRAVKASSSVNLDCEVINCHTIKPLEGETILASVGKTGCAVTVEEHNIHGGLGDAISQLLAQHYPVPQEFIAINDRFGQSARSYDDLIKEYGLDENAIRRAIVRVFERKKR